MAQRESQESKSRIKVLEATDYVFKKRFPSSDFCDHR